MRISADKLNAAVAHKPTGLGALGAKISEDEFQKLRREGGNVSQHTAFGIGVAFGVDPRSLLATKDDVAAYNRLAANS